MPKEHMTAIAVVVAALPLAPIYMLDDFDQAVHDYSEAIQLAPHLALAYYYRSLSYAQKGDQEHAQADQKKARQLDAVL